MPVSRSPSRDAKLNPRPRTAPKGATAGGASGNGAPRSIWPIVLIVIAVVLAAIVALLPASSVSHFLPPSVHAEDFSGSLWHGSAGKITIDARDVGAVEWRAHPASLFGLAVAADLHWVKVGFVLDAVVTIRRGGFSAHDITGGGPVEDLRDLGVAAGWRGTASVNFSELSGDFAKPVGAVGDVRVSNLTSAQFADGADLGGYDLRFVPGDGAGLDAAGTGGGGASGGELVAELTDTGGPLELQASVRYTPNERRATLSGTLRERPEAPAALRSQVANLSQIRGRDPQGRVPVEFEFTM